MENKNVCIVNIDKAPQPVFVREKDTKSFYIRSGSTNRLLNSEETYNYIQQYWQKKLNINKRIYSYKNDKKIF